MATTPTETPGRDEPRLDVSMNSMNYNATQNEIRHDEVKIVTTILENKMRRDETTFAPTY